VVRIEFDTLEAAWEARRRADPRYDPRGIVFSRASAYKIRGLRGRPPHRPGAAADASHYRAFWQPDRCRHRERRGGRFHHPAAGAGDHATYLYRSMALPE